MIDRIYAKHCGRTIGGVERTLDRDLHVAGRSPRLGPIDVIFTERAELAMPVPELPMGR